MSSESFENFSDFMCYFSRKVIFLLHRKPNLIENLIFYVDSQMKTI